ncbi:decarboxylase [Dyella telluris]|uniref:Decarboxylase n=1 Tax=Dyella telluris TaxID=2763498 RepID=A0A7G8Q3B8_9GAMM|nr:decarboxylase [Dyella telluris]QNK01276.1 decarboxylase [Dyella telluris]
MSLGDITDREARHIFNPPSLRADLWMELLAAARRWKTGKGSGNLRAELAQAIASMEPVESLFAYPGAKLLEALKARLQEDDPKAFYFLARRISTAIISGSYRHDSAEWDVHEDVLDPPTDRLSSVLGGQSSQRPYFETLVVTPFEASRWGYLTSQMRRIRRPEDEFVYEPVVVGSFEDALCAIFLNPQILSVVLYEGFAFRSATDVPQLRGLLNAFGLDKDESNEEAISLRLAELIKRVRPEVDVFLLTDRFVERLAGDPVASCVRRIFYQVEEPLELHLSILEGIRDRYQTPFFDNLKEYARKPVATFHALPIARGKAVFKSAWISDMGEFYGPNLFLAESSATTGGLDSLLEPTGNIKKAQDLAARAFGADKVFFVTNGTSTSNKMVIQALLAPGDIAVIDRNCHKSHHYGCVLSGAQPYYVEAYPLAEYSMYGAVPIATIKKALLDLKAAGRLDRVRIVDLTNCTFDGHIYNTRRVMEECLAIKPDLIFLWDEAWFGFAHWSPFLRPRTAMGAADALERYLQSPEAIKAYEAQQAKLGDNPSDETLLSTRLVPDPRKVRLRVYQTNSTHKSMSAIRQGSMILVHDVDFHSVEEQFHEAVFTHASTSPNQQLIASLDVARRQMELEGYGLVMNAIEIALEIRRQINTHPIISKYFRALDPGDLIPASFRESGFARYLEPGASWSHQMQGISNDEFCLDPTRMTVVCGTAGFDGTSFKMLLADKYGIQLNKTSRNSVLLQSNINNTRSDVALLVRVLLEICAGLESKFKDGSGAERASFDRHVNSLMHDVPDLPDFSCFHPRYRKQSGEGTLEGDMRTAFFDAYDAAKCEHLPLFDCQVEKRLASGPEMVSANFVIPYPPGFPIMVPGQVITQGIIDFMRKLDVKEIHGYNHEQGLKLIKVDGEHREASKTPPVSTKPAAKKKR